MAGLFGEKLESNASVHLHLVIDSAWMSDPWGVKWMTCHHSLCCHLLIFIQSTNKQVSKPPSFLIEFHTQHHLIDL